MGFTEYRSNLDISYARSSKIIELSVQMNTRFWIFRPPTAQS